MEQLKKLAEFAAGLRLEDTPANVVKAAKGCVLDTVFVAAGAAENELYQNVKELYLRQEGLAKRQSSLWGGREKVSPRNATLLQLLYNIPVKSNNPTAAAAPG